MSTPTDCAASPSTLDVWAAAILSARCDLANQETLVDHVEYLEAHASDRALTNVGALLLVHERRVARVPAHRALDVEERRLARARAQALLAIPLGTQLLKTRHELDAEHERGGT